MSSNNERLDYLVEAFKKDSTEYKHIKVPGDVNSKRQILRSLMNIRLPKPMDEEVIKIQDEYLQERAKEKGIVNLIDIPTIKQSLNSTHKFADKISLWQGDITRIACDAIVNAANSQMLGCFIPMHTCIDNSIHTFAGIELREECNNKMNELRQIHGQDYEQPTAIPMITDAYNLPSKKVIHIVGPIVQGPLRKNHEELLASCYKSCLDIAEDNRLKSIAFCCISTGVFMFPNQRAAEIAVETVKEWLNQHEGNSIEKVIFNVYKDLDLKIYAKLFSD